MRIKNISPFLIGMLVSVAPLIAQPMTLTIPDTKQIDAKSISSITQAIQNQEPIQAVKNANGWQVAIGAPNEESPSPEMIQFLLTLTMTQPENLKLARAAELYALDYINSQQGGVLEGDAGRLLHQTVAKQIGVSPTILERWPDFERFIIANKIERDLKSRGDKITIGRYGIPTLTIKGNQYSWTLFKKKFPVDEKTGMMQGIAYTHRGFEPINPQDLETLEQLRADAERQENDQSARIAKVQDWLQTVKAQASRTTLPQSFIDHLKNEVEGNQANGMQAALTEIRQQQQNLPDEQFEYDLGQLYQTLRQVREILDLQSRWIALQSNVEKTAKLLHRPLAEKQLSDLGPYLGNLEAESQWVTNKNQQIPIIEQRQLETLNQTLLQEGNRLKALSEWAYLTRKPLLDQIEAIDKYRKPSLLIELQAIEQEIFKAEDPVPVIYNLQSRIAQLANLISAVQNSTGPAKTTNNIDNEATLSTKWLAFQQSIDAFQLISRDPTISLNRLENTIQDLELLNTTLADIKVMNQTLASISLADIRSREALLNQEKTRLDQLKIWVPQRESLLSQINSLAEPGKRQMQDEFDSINRDVFAETTDPQTVIDSRIPDLQKGIEYFQSRSSHPFRK